MTPFDIQCRLLAYGIDPGPLDGQMGRLTRRGMTAFRRQYGRRIEADFHPSGLCRVIGHWTAGSEGVIELEREHYNLIIGQDARTYAGLYRPEANGRISGGYAAHTRALNTGSIGVALDAMAGAQERPFKPGRAPITEQMVAAFAREVADLCLTYRIPVSRWTVLTHAEVQPTLGVWQRNKWDITWLPDMDVPGDPVRVGDRLRELIRAEMPAVRLAAA